MSALFTAVEGFLVTRDNERLRARLTAVNTELREIGERLLRLGRKLADSPENVCFEGQPVPVDFFVSDDFTFTRRDVDFDRITSLITEKREIWHKLTALNRESEGSDVAPLEADSTAAPADSRFESFLTALTALPGASGAPPSGDR